MNTSSLDWGSPFADVSDFAGLRQEVLLIGIDDHFEVWDAATWRRYTQQKSAAARAAMAERD